MKGQRDGAVYALKSLATGAAGDEARKAAAVEQQHGLLAVFEALGSSGGERARKGRLFARLEKLLAHIDDLDHRHGPAFDSLRQFEAGVLSRGCVVTAFETGRGRTEHHHGARVSRANDRDVAAVIA